MSRIVDFIASILESIISLPLKIVEAFGLDTLFENVTNWLKDIFNKIADLPITILNGIKSIFIPDTVEINNQFNSTMQDLKNKIGIEVFDLENLFSSSNAPSDISSDYNISGVGTMNLKFVDFQYLIKGVEFFRPFIRGFIVLLLFFYNIRQLLSMFGLNSGEIDSAAKKEGIKK